MLPKSLITMWYDKNDKTNRICNMNAKTFLKFEFKHVNVNEQNK